MPDFLKDYSNLPEQLLTAANEQSVSPLAFCTRDTSDCSSDCSKDSAFCTRDASDCSSDCSKDSCSSDGGGCTNDAQPPTPNPPTGTGSLTLISRTSNSVTLRLKSISGATSYETVYRKVSQSVAPSGNYGSTTSLTWTITGLEANTEYVFNYRGVNGGGSNGYMASGLTVRTLPDKIDFDWTYAGTDDNGRPIYGSEKIAGLGIYVSADEWNELADLVSEKTGKYVEKVSSGTPISAYIVNTMASALGVSRVYSDETVYTADFFNRLRSAYNNL